MVLTRHDLRVRWIRLLPWLPGAVVATALWLWVLVRFDYAADAQENIDLLWQSLGSGILSADPVGGLTVLHIQPPLLNLLFAVDLAVTPQSHVLLLLVNFAAMIASISLLTDSLVRVGAPRWLAGSAGVAYALLPGTVAYSLWVYNVTLTGLFAIAAIWGVSLMRTRAFAGSVVSAVAVFALVVTRSTFALPILLAWVAALAWMVWRSNNRRAVWALLAVVLAGVGVQAHYLMNFGLVTMSSWGGQNIINATNASGVLTVTDSANARIAQDPCKEAAWLAFREQRLNLWDPGGLFALPECATVEIAPERNTLAWDAQFRPGSEELNLNWRYGLAASGVWTDIAIDLVRGDPLQLVRMAVAPPAGVLESGVARYLSRSENYRWVSASADSLPLPSVGQAYSTVFAPAAWLVTVLGWLVAASVKAVRRQTRPAYWFGSALLAFHATASTLLEYAEAMRFRAEVEPVLMFVAMASLWMAWKGFSRRISTGKRIDTSRGSEQR